MKCRSVVRAFLLIAFSSLLGFTQSLPVSPQVNIAGEPDPAWIAITGSIHASEGSLVDMSQHIEATFNSTEVPILPGARLKESDRATVSVAALQVPGKARKELRKAEELVLQERLEEGSEHVRRALEIYPDFADAYGLRGVIALEKNDLKAASADLEHALRLDPVSGFLCIALGRVYNSMHRFDDALAMLERGLTLSPTSWQAHVEIAKIMLVKGNYFEALRETNKALDLTSKDIPLLHLVRSNAYLGLKDYDGAALELQAYLANAPEGPFRDSAQQQLDRIQAAVVGKRVSSE